MSDRTCSIDGCATRVQAHGWCGKHYYHWRRYGEPTPRKRGEVRNGKRICAGCKLDVLEGDFSPGNSRCKPCKAAAKRQRPRVVVEYAPVFCVECGTPFLPGRRTDVACSSGCSGARKRRFDLEDAANRPRDEANAANRKWYLENRDTAHKSSAAYRARKMSAFVEDVDRQVVFERDRWICQICSEPVDKQLKRPDMMSVSVDHRIPLAHGGKHSYENCQTAHLICNVQKGARIIQ